MKSIIRLLKIFLILCLCAAAYIAVTELLILSHADGRIVLPEEISGDYDCIIVLGAGVRDDGSPSAMLEDRMLTGIELYESCCSDVLLLSGDHGQADYDEVNCMKDIAEEAGVPTDDIFLDHAGFCTYDSIYRLKKIFGCDKAIIVSQDYHLPRALWIAESLGIEAVGVAANPREYRGQLMRDIREYIARSKDFLWCIVKPLPKYLGETISLSGSGVVTHDK